ncbi:hypothetical protein QBC42DRAFT_267127 [Cladorrhinum samala]|uniref:Secreted protein n=1 Tax=Cladorrhinum samala TaxID=585594 RepID=A0AAV9HPM8_9PEZI|nr:hypothetical protein QBC42DRAFT_267127 [Cladorrhinum samala]
MLFCVLFVFSRPVGRSYSANMCLGALNYGSRLDGHKLGEREMDNGGWEQNCYDLLSKRCTNTGITFLFDM